MVGKARNVAWMVYRGRQPGVYNSASEAVAQTTGFPGNKVVGYCAADGGLSKAQDVYNAYAHSIQAVCAAPADKDPHIDTEDSPTSKGEKSDFSEDEERETWSEDLNSTQSERASENEVNGPSAVDNEIKEEPNQNESDLQHPSLPPQVDSQEPVGVCVKREDSGSYTSRLKRRASQSTEAMPDSKNLRHNCQYESEERQRSVEAKDFWPATVHPPQRHGELQEIISKCGVNANGGLKTESAMSHEGPIQHPWLGHFGFTKRHNHNSLMTAISSVSTVVTSQCDPPLCQEQLDLIDTVLSGQNVFYTGSAGCGKSFVLKVIVEILMRLGVHVYIVAPTGCAALAAGGRTYWSYAGWTPNLMKKPLVELERLCRMRRPRKRLNHTEVLVIDEVSMLENHQFERLNCIMKAARAPQAHEAAFGGVQLIVTGDFCQLPPVVPFKFCYPCGHELTRLPDRNYRCDLHGEFRHSDQWAFKSDAWAECDFVHVNLTQFHRQSDPDFIRILESFRLGKSLSCADQELLLHHESETTGAVKLFPKRDQVKATNDREFALLTSPIKTFMCRDHFQLNPNHAELASKGQRDPIDDALIAQEDHRYEKKVDLREGTVVILLANLDLDHGLVNGSQGIVTGFAKVAEDFAEPRHHCDVKHYRYKLARIAEFAARTSIIEYPVVRFFNGIERTIYGDCQVEELGEVIEPNDNYTLSSRSQIPLVPAWAMTIHKSQGMTLMRVIVNLSDAWEEGQEYVALSRARSLQGLKVEALSYRERDVNPQVMQFLWEIFEIQ